MIKGKNIIFAIFITLFFLLIAYFTTFRLALYSFIICYIGVIIAKSKNKRLKVPVTSFFVLTFLFGVVLAFFYSLSPKIQYYEFKMVHSRWQITQVDSVEIKRMAIDKANTPFEIYEKLDTNIYFKNETEKVKLNHSIHYFQTNIFELFSSKGDLKEISLKNVNDLNDSKDLYVFKKPNKNIYKVFSKNEIFSNGKSGAHFMFSVLFLCLFVFGIFKIILNLRKIISVILNQYPKKDFFYYTSLILFLISYTILALSSIV